MKEQILNAEIIKQFEKHLRSEEKHIRDVTAFAEYLGGKIIRKLTP